MKLEIKLQRERQLPKGFRNQSFVLDSNYSNITMVISKIHRDTERQRNESWTE